VHRVRLRRHLPHAKAGVVKAAVTAGIVVVGAAVAAAVVLPKPTGHATPAPAPTTTTTPTPAQATTPALATAPAPAPAPAQLTGTQLATALLPVSDFPAGYSAIGFVVTNSGTGPATIPATVASCRLGMMPGAVESSGGFFPDYGTAAAADSFLRDSTGGSLGLRELYLSEAVFQFSSPAGAEGFFSSVRTCLIDNEPWSDGVDTAPVNGDQAVTADLRYNDNSADQYDPLFVLHGTDVFALSAASSPSTGPPTIPGAAELIARLIARVDALTLPSSAVSSPTSSAGSSPAVASRRQAAQDLAALLTQSGTDRTAITQAFNAVADCSAGLSQDETVFSTAASSHQALLGQLAALPDRSALPASMLQDLTAAWQASAQADHDFAGWAQDEITHGCSTNYKSDASYQAATGPDKQATTDKKAFAALWTAIANEYGLPSYKYNQI
jgi:hypothetical protein